MRILERARATMEKVGEVIVPPREGNTFEVPKGHFFRIVSVEGPQVGDLNLWNANDLSSASFPARTGAACDPCHDRNRLWSNLPSLRPMATISLIRSAGTASTNSAGCA